MPIDIFPDLNNLREAYLFLHPVEKIRSEIAYDFSLKILKSRKSENNPDFLNFHPDTHKYGIDLIKKVRLELSYKPYQENYRILLLHEAQNLTPEAQNAFLKTLEEPPQNSIIILTANHKDNLLPTLSSRCEIYNFQENQTAIPEIDLPEIEVFNALIGKPLYQKFAWAEQNHKEENIIQKLQNFLIYNRKLLLEKFNKNMPHENHKILENLAILEKTIYSLKNTNINKRLLLERLMIKLDL